MSIFPGGVVPTNRDERLAVLLKLTEKESVRDLLEELDAEFYKYQDNIKGRLEAYMRAHQDADVAA